MREYYIRRCEYSNEIIRRRRCIVRKQKMYLCLALVMLTIVITTFAGTRFAFAKPNTNGPERIKVYKSIVIYGGDTLFSIASEYCSDEWKDRASYIHEVSKINHLDDNDMLIAGNYLIVPYYTDVPAE